MIALIEAKTCNHFTLLMMMMMMHDGIFNRYID
jgi:hypothetical protein